MVKPSVPNYPIAFQSKNICLEAYAIPSGFFALDIAVLKSNRKHLCALLFVTSCFCMSVWSTYAEESCQHDGIMSSGSFLSRFCMAACCASK